MMTAVALSSFTILILLAGSGRSAGRVTGSPPSLEDQDVSTADEPSVADRGPQHHSLQRPHHPSWRRRTLVILAIGVVSVVAGPLMTVAAVVGSFALPRLRTIVSARAERRSMIAALPDAIELLVLVIHAGLTPHQAVALLAERAPPPTRPAFAEVARRTRRGTPLADALQALPDVLGPAATGVADTLAMAERHGTPITQALEQLSFEVRERRQRQSEAAARQLPIRLSFPLVTCTLPSFVLVAIVPAVLGALASLDTSGL